MVKNNLVGGWPTPLKDDGLRQLGWWHSQLNGKIKVMFQTTNLQGVAICGLLDSIFLLLLVIGMKFFLAVSGGDLTTIKNHRKWCGKKHLQNCRTTASFGLNTWKSSNKYGKQWKTTVFHVIHEKSYGWCHGITATPILLWRDVVTIWELTTLPQRNDHPMKTCRTTKLKKHEQQKPVSYLKLQDILSCCPHVSVPCPKNLVLQLLNFSSLCGLEELSIVLLLPHRHHRAKSRHLKGDIDAAQTLREWSGPF